MPLGGVKIIKSQIIQQICQLEVSKLTKPENQLVKTFLNTFQASHNPQIFFIYPQSVKNNPQEPKNLLWRCKKSQNRQYMSKYVKLKL